MPSLFSSLLAAPSSPPSHHPRCPLSPPITLFLSVRITPLITLTLFPHIVRHHRVTLSLSPHITLLVAVALASNRPSSLPSHHPRCSPVAPQIVPSPSRSPSRSSRRPRCSRRNFLSHPPSPTPSPSRSPQNAFPSPTHFLLPSPASSPSRSHSTPSRRPSSLPSHHRPRRPHCPLYPPGSSPTSSPSLLLCNALSAPFLPPLTICLSSPPPVPLSPSILSFLSTLPSRLSSSLPSHPVVPPLFPPIPSFFLPPLPSRRSPSLPFSPVGPLVPSQELAQRFAAMGARLILSARSAERLQAVGASCCGTHAPEGVVVLPFDLKGGADVLHDAVRQAESVLRGEEARGEEGPLNSLLPLLVPPPPPPFPAFPLSSPLSCSYFAPHQSMCSSSHVKTLQRTLSGAHVLHLSLLSPPLCSAPPSACILPPPPSLPFPPIRAC
ncbi:unnamed protein product [Closterium sp. Naga37s-1]|nr:unnamed protein product [Closterium sp. Naga37s-1]